MSGRRLEQNVSRDQSCGGALREADGDCASACRWEKPKRNAMTHTYSLEQLTSALYRVALY